MDTLVLNSVDSTLIHCLIFWVHYIATATHVTIVGITGSFILDSEKQVAVLRSALISCRSGETGRRTGLKIQRALRPCRFDSDLRHQ